MALAGLSALVAVSLCHGASNLRYNLFVRCVTSSSSNTPMSPGRRTWRDLAELASKEHDPQRLTELIEELNAALEAEESLRRAPIRQGTRVLFVDDEESIRVTLPAVLGDRGLDVAVAATTPEALAKMQAGRFDVLLADLNIGQAGDGITLARTMRQINPQCVRLILTGSPALDSAIDAIQHEVDGYVVKPADIDVLVNTIRRLVDERREKERVTSSSQ